MGEKRKIDVEESKIQGRIVTREIDKNDPDYKKYPDKTEYVDDFYIHEIGDMDNRDEPSTGIEIYYLYLFIVSFFIPLSFVFLKAFIVGGDPGFFWKMTFYVGFIVLYSLFVFIVPIIALRRKDISLRHKKIIRLIMGNNIVILMWISVFIITPMILVIDVPIGKARITFLLYFLLAIFDIAAQLFIAHLKEEYPHREEILERISLVLSIAAIWGYGAIICPLIFGKTIERVIFDISILAFVGLMSVINLIAYKSRKNIVEEDYKYNAKDLFKGRRMKKALILEGILVGVMWFILMFAGF